MFLSIVIWVLSCNAHTCTVCFGTVKVHVQYERQVCVCVHVHTTVTPFVHELDIACKNVLISHSSMMRCCTCSLISTCTMFPLTLAKEPHYSDDFFHLTTPSLQYSKNKNV